VKLIITPIKRKKIKKIPFFLLNSFTGTTHKDAELFCKTVGNMHLCPAEACEFVHIVFSDQGDDCSNFCFSNRFFFG